MDPARAAKGDYYGHLTATAADGSVSVHTTLSLVVRGPVHRLKVVSYDNDGNRVDALPMIWGAEGFVGYTDRDNAVAEVEEGTYQLTSGSIERVDGEEVLRQVVLPDIKVIKDTTVVVDPRRTVKVEIRTPRPAEQRGVLSYQTYRKIDGHAWIDGTMYFDIATALYVSPTPKSPTAPSSSPPAGSSSPRCSKPAWPAAPVSTPTTCPSRPCSTSGASGSGRWTRAPWSHPTSAGHAVCSPSSPTSGERPARSWRSGPPRPASAPCWS